jgi:hypothetical protein
LLNVLLHALNAGFVWRLAYLLSNKKSLLYATIASSFFTTYPFSYQAVPYVGALSHPLVTFLVLVSIVLYWESRIRRSKVILIISIVSASLAPFAHENGVLIFLLLIMLEILKRQGFGNISRWPFLYFVIAFLFFVLWLRIPKAREPFQFPSLERLWRNGAFFLQGLISPTAPLAKLPMRLLQLNDIWSVLLISVLSLAPLSITLAKFGYINILLFSLGWFSISVMPAWTMLDPNYVIDGARLLYLASTATSLLWAAFPLSIYSLKPKFNLNLLMFGTVLFILLGQNISFVYDRMGLYLMGRDFIHSSAQITAASSEEESLLFVNIPQWLARKETFYALGREGVMFLPDYTNFQSLAYINSGVERHVGALTFPNIMKPTSYYHGFWHPVVGWEGLNEEIRKASEVHLVEYLPKALRVVEAGDVRGGENCKTFLAIFDDSAVLCQVKSELKGYELNLTLEWKCLRAVEGNYTVFMHLHDYEGRLIAQDDGYPLKGLFPPWIWQEGDIIRDIRNLPLHDLPTGYYTVAVGLYSLETGTRMRATNEQDTRYENDAVIIFEFRLER